MCHIKWHNKCHNSPTWQVVVSRGVSHMDPPPPSTNINMTLIKTYYNLFFIFRLNYSQKYINVLRKLYIDLIALKKLCRIQLSSSIILIIYYLSSCYNRRIWNYESVKYWRKKIIEGSSIRNLVSWENIYIYIYISYLNLTNLVGV